MHRQGAYFTFPLLLTSILFSPLVSCGGAVATHSGYQNSTSQPWKRARSLAFDADREAEADGFVSYPQRKRARWYAFDLPTFAELSVRLEVTPLKKYRTFDLPIEILNSKFQVIMRSDPEDDDFGELEKKRTLYELAPGTYYAHLYARRRVDEADYSLRLLYKPIAATTESNAPMPIQLPLPRPLPLVPVVDDSPEINCRACNCGDPPCKYNCARCTRAVSSSPCRKCDCSRGNCRFSCSQCKPVCSECTCEDRLCKRWCRSKCSPKSVPGTVGSNKKARIIGVVLTSSGTRITLNKGANHGVAAGWKGAVITRDGRAIPGGSFRVTRVTATKSYAIVRASSDQVAAARSAFLRKP